ncbi:uncharacterized protein [Panulirus ornatus]|uniref:uncharacterized protein n=1 Tax=Panulirus ornatus TaxID=150431 RepID=UPI003A8B74D3
MLLPAPPLTALALLTLASGSFCHAGHIGLHQSPAAAGDDVSDSHPITKSQSLSSSGKFTSPVDPQSLVKVKVIKDHYTLPEADDVTEVSTRLGDVTEVSTHATDVTELSTRLDDVTQVNTHATDVTELSTRLDDVTQVSTHATDVTELSTRLDDVTQVSTHATDVTELSTRLDDVIEANTHATDVTEANTHLNDVAVTNTLPNDVTKTSIVKNDVTDIKPRLDVTEDVTQLNDVTGMDGVEPDIMFDDVTEESFSTNEVAETRMRVGDVQVETQPDDITSTRPDVTETRSISDIRRPVDRLDVTEGYTQLDDVTDSMVQLDDVTDNMVQLDDVTDNMVQLDDVTDSMVQLDDVTDNMVQLDDVTDSMVQLDDVRDTIAQLDDVSDGDNFPAISESSAGGGEGNGDSGSWRPVDQEDDLDLLDDHGFLVSSLPDQEDDLRIYEAVVTSMAKWELHKLHKKRVKRDEEVVCYMELGCFRDEGPYDYLDMLPSPPEEVNTRFLLYTRERPDRERVIRTQNITNILTSHFNASRPTKLLIHGFGSSCFSVWIREMRVAILTMMDVNIICVNWQKGAEVPNYVRAASNTRLVGRQVALLIETLNAFVNTSLDDFHLIGFSLGAHVSGHAGARLKNLSRISGLDPAGPLFESYSPSVRLDHTDARFVDVIHTNADSLLMGGLGAFEAMGHVDFYPNGGRMQKGCANLFVGGVSDILWPTEGDGRYLCNHRRGYKYYLNSLAPICKFPSFVCRDYETFLKGDCFPCTSCGNMGYFANQAEGRGPLYLVTRDTEPFCANQYKVMVHHSGGPPADPVTTYGRLDITFVAAGGINETLQLTQSDDTAMEAGKLTVRIMVPHPALSDLQAIQLRYTAYQGWIYSGFSRWAIDKISLMDSFGIMLSFCHRGTTLVSGKTIHLTLLPVDCLVRDIPVVTGPNPHQFLDPLNEESENEVQQTTSLQLAVVPHVKPTHNITVHHSPFNLTEPIPKPMLTPMDAHNSMLSPHQGHVLLPITLNVPSDQKEISQDFHNISILKPLHPPHIIFTKLPSKRPSIQQSVSGDIVTSPASPPESVDRDVATSSEEPVNVIPAPDLATFPSPKNFTNWPSVPHRPMGSVPTPVNVYTPENGQASNGAEILMHLHSTTSVPILADHNFTQDHPLHVNRPHFTTQHSSPTLEESMPPTAAFPTPANPTISATSVSTDAMEKILPTQMKNVMNDTHLDSDIVENSTSNIKIMVNDHTVHSLPGSTSSLPSPVGSVFPPFSPPQTPESKSVQSGSVSHVSSPTTVASTSPTTPTSRLHHPAATQFGHSIGDKMDAVPPVQLRRPPNFHHYQPPAPTREVSYIQTGINNQVPMVLNTNSLIDGEVPDRDRARALTLGSIPINSVNPQRAGNGREGQPSLPVSPTIYSSAPSQTSISHAGDAAQRVPFHQPSPQRTFPHDIDTPSQPHSHYVYTYHEDSQPHGVETVFRPVETLPHKLSAPTETHQRSPSPSEPQPRPLTPHDAQVRPPVAQAEVHTAFANNPQQHPAGPSHPPETIIGHGRAPQPILSSHSQEPWQLKQSQKHQGIQLDHEQDEGQNYKHQASNGQAEATSHSQHQQHHSENQYHYYHSQHQEHHPQQQYHTQHQEQHHAWQQQHHRRSQQVKQPSEKVSMTVSVGNVTRINLEGVPSRSPRPVPAPSPFYVQLLPPSFSHLPHLETFSLPRDSRKSQDPPNRKRGGMNGRANRGRSLSVPAPGGRAAVFTPLVLQLQDDHRGRYIPLRYIHETPLLT